jgi:DNA topoisomerase-1
LITYMRTDSVRIEPDIQLNIRKYIEKNYGADYLSGVKKVAKKEKGNVQDAHEAIRPVNVELTPQFVAPYLNPDLLKVYALIWNRTVASFMKAAQIEKTKAVITQGAADFGIQGEKVVFPGYTVVYNNLSLKENPLLNKLSEGEELKLKKYEKEQLFTKPKPRYTDASLIKELEEKGIRRPSTYATIVSTLYDRKYALREEKKIKPTDLGVIVSLLLDKNFKEVINEDFTAEMEESLDKVEKGEMEWQALIDQFYKKLSKIIDKVEKELPRVNLKTDVKCEKCGASMLFKLSGNGTFLGCSKYPKCKFTLPLPPHQLFLLDLKNLDDTVVCKELIEKLKDEKQIIPEEEKDYGVCEKCGSPMVLKSGRYGQFLACSAYPKCKNTKPINQNLGKCPKEGCDGDIVMRRTKRGRKFYGCSNYPKCDFVSWTKPQTSDKDNKNSTSSSKKSNSKKKKK